MWGGGRTEANWEGEPRAWWGRVKKGGGQNGSENVWFLGCCDASDGEERIISVMRGLGGNVNSLLPGVGVHVDDRRGGITGREQWLERL